MNDPLFNSAYLIAMPNTRYFLFIERNIAGGKWRATGWSDDEAVVIRQAEWLGNTCGAFGMGSIFGWVELGLLSPADRLELMTQVNRLE